ncbi:hypothetical protein [Pseudoruegeria sp. SK021]|uniref:hypothetical protein n=1 Tax=Pseudoruegeria sp. SK021 TaxID=1933035 RepID=UPI000A234CF5|nr:hypothetical protein [Pseudoruegeria sp. SK021]OSP55722.1 hypothetical protein BV911_06345 [Pseudoruegeria sp. SK021]
MKRSVFLFIAGVCLMLLRAGTAEAQLLATGVQGDRTAPIVDGIAPVTSQNTWRDPLTGVWRVGLAPDPSRLRQPVVDPASAAPAMGMLRRLYAQGRAAGLATTLYDNRDRDHSPLSPTAFPQLSHTAYSQDLSAMNLDYNWAGGILFPLAVIGNSSTARVSGPLARSLGRISMGGQINAERSYELYAHNHSYVYPEHRDHDPNTGDRFFANAPYFLMSQGSSYSDKPFVTALALIYASYTPETRARLDESGLLASVTQMVLRRSLSGIQTPQDYLSPRAHPVVFDKSQLRPAAMVGLANAIMPDAIPPMVKLKVESEFPVEAGRDYLADNLDEVIFTTPSAIARAWRSFAYSRSMSISASETVDPNGRPLTFHWVILQGDPQRIDIQVRDSGDSADIRVDWQGAIPSSTGANMMSSRVDIGVFADNGVWISAPAIVSISFPVFQNRIYEGQDGATPRLVSLDYVVDPDDIYADPTLWPTADWDDTITYDPNGAISQIVRTFPDGQTQTLTMGLADFIRNQTFGVPDRIRHSSTRAPKGQLRLDAHVVD